MHFRNLYTSYPHSMESDTHVRIFVILSCARTCADQIVTGSLAGVLRIYQPSSSGDENGSSRSTRADFNIEDLLYEHNFTEPILGVSVGSFTSQGHIVIALLFSRKLSVHRLVRNDGGAGAASFYTLGICYEHMLDRRSCNMCTGQFGGAYNFTYIAVQSLDGSISVFENESHAYSRFIPNFLLPGPMSYCLATDSIITANSAFEVCSFKCATLAAAIDSRHAANANGNGRDNETLSGMESFSVGGGSASSAINVASDAGSRRDVPGANARSVREDWKVVLGELALDIQVGRVLSGTSSSSAAGAAGEDIVVLCESTLFVLNDYGRIKQQRRLEYMPVCMHLYTTGDAGMKNILVGSSTGVVLVYRNLDLVWSAKCDHTNVALRVCRAGGIRGMIVGLGDAGQLNVSYVGTDPPVGGSIGGANADGLGAGGDNEMEYEEMDNEHRQLLAKIRERSNTAANSTSGAGESGTEGITIRAQVPSRLDAATSTSSYFDDGDAYGEMSGGATGISSGRRLTVQLFLSGSGRRTIEEVSLQLSAPRPFFIVGESSIAVGSVPGDSDGFGRTAAPVAVSFTVGINSDMIPSSTDMFVTAQYICASGAPGVETIKVALPLCLSADAIPPVKAEGFKVTLETNRQPPLLSALFDDLIASGTNARGGGAALPMEPGSSNIFGNALTLKLLGGVEVTILVSKNAGRYRIQSSCFEAMWLAANELHKRLKMYFVASQPGHAVDGSGTGGGDTGFVMSFGEQLPLHDYFSLIDSHHAARAELTRLKRQLSRAAHQFRAVQKRILARHKNTSTGGGVSSSGNSTASNLSMLLSKTFTEISGVVESIAACEGQVVTAGNRLACGTQLMLLLMRLQFDLDDDAHVALSSYISPDVLECMDSSSGLRGNDSGTDAANGDSDGTSIGWEEVTASNIMYLLRTQLSMKAGRGGDDVDAASAQHAVVLLHPLESTDKLKRHISIVCERLSHGARITGH